MKKGQVGLYTIQMPGYASAPSGLRPGIVPRQATAATDLFVLVIAQRVTFPLAMPFKDALQKMYDLQAQAPGIQYMALYNGVMTAERVVNATGGAIAFCQNGQCHTRTF